MTTYTVKLSRRTGAGNMTLTSFTVNAADLPDALVLAAAELTKRNFPRT